MHCSTSGDDQEEEEKHIRRHKAAAAVDTEQELQVNDDRSLSVAEVAAAREQELVVNDDRSLWWVVEICAYYKAAKPCEEVGICAHSEVGWRGRLVLVWHVMRQRRWQILNRSCRWMTTDPYRWWRWLRPVNRRCWWMTTDPYGGWWWRVVVIVCTG